MKTLLLLFIVGIVCACNNRLPEDDDGYTGLGKEVTDTVRVDTTKIVKPEKCN